MLKRLELIGFKSFATKTILEFPKGISAIVGPNGSGKSNVIDALRWLLGERDAKNLRGGKVEDLIFAGTPAKPRVGLAQASIYFDNSNAFFPVDFSEVAVSREVRRDGESKYYLNKAEVRLRDIIDFFARVRLGARGMTVIGQGASDMLIQATPVERREMLEEMLGLREYQLKKLEAERKHKHTSANLEQVSVLLDEITPHLKMLERQTAKWQKRNETEATLRDLEHSYFAARLAEVKTHYVRLDPQVSALDQKINAQKVALQAGQANLKTLEEGEPEKHKQLAVLKKNQDEIVEKRSLLQRDLGKIDAQLEFLGTKSSEAPTADPRELSALLKKVQKTVQSFKTLEIGEIRKLAMSLDADIDAVFKVRESGTAEQELLTTSQKKLQASLKAFQEELAHLQTEEKNVSASLQSQSAEFKKAIAGLEKDKTALYVMQEEKNKLLFERERWSIKEGDLQTQMAQAGFDAKNLKIDMAVSHVSPINFDEHERKMFRLRGELAAIGEIDQQIVKEAEETGARHLFLTTQSADLRKAMLDLENLKRELEEKIRTSFESSLHNINAEFTKLFELMFGGGKAKFKIENRKLKIESRKEDTAEEATEKKPPESDEEVDEPEIGLDIEVSIPRKRITGLDMLSGGERSLVSIAALFALVSVSPPPFLVLDEIDAALDERNARRFAEMLKNFSNKTQFVVVTHNRATMEVADVLYGVTMGEDGTSKVLSLKLENKTTV
ncbi:MAG: AAA family ATPase [bacterium]|nr:AAA family ATPase [bacterium]